MPAMPTVAVAAHQPAATSAAARFWAIYMSGLHGDVTPSALSQLSGLNVSEATSLRAELIRNHVIKPQGLIKKAVSTALDPNPLSEQVASLDDLTRDILEDRQEIHSDASTEANAQSDPDF